jgi:addiction module RelE/StbE family toxin
MMIYDVDMSGQAEVDLRNLYIHIAEELQSPENADGQLERIEEAIYKLNKFPERFPLYDDEPWRSKGVRTLVVDNYVVIYVVKKESEQVTVIRVMYSGRDIKAQLEISQ